MESPSLRRADIQPTGAIGFAARNLSYALQFTCVPCGPIPAPSCFAEVIDAFESTGVDFDPIGIYMCSCFVLPRTPSIAAFDGGAGRGARQWHRGGAPGGAGSYVTGHARPKRQPLVTG